MKRLAKLDFKGFVDEIMRWNVTDKSLNPLLRQEFETYYVFYLLTPLVDYCFAVYKVHLSPVNKMNLMEISIPAEIVTGEVKLDKESIDKIVENKMAAQTNKSVEQAKKAGFYDA